MHSGARDMTFESQTLTRDRVTIPQSYGLRVRRDSLTSKSTNSYMESPDKDMYQIVSEKSARFGDII